MMTQIDLFRRFFQHMENYHLDLLDNLPSMSMQSSESATPWLINKVYRSILCLNGNMPDIAFFNQQTLPVIATDGAANALDAYGIDIQAVVGDLDSIKPILRNKYPLIHEPNQNYSDFQKAIRYLKNNGLLPAIVVGVNGGYLDHILNNINVFFESDSVYFDPPIVGHLLREGSRKAFRLPRKSKLSLMAMPDAVISTSGLQWNLQNSELKFPGFNAYFNRTEQENLTIQVHRGAVLVMIYLDAITDAAIW